MQLRSLPAVLYNFQFTLLFSVFLLYRRPPRWVFPAVWIPLKVLQSVRPQPALVCVCWGGGGMCVWMERPVQPALINVSPC